MQVLTDPGLLRAVAIPYICSHYYKLLYESMLRITGENSES